MCCSLSTLCTDLTAPIHNDKPQLQVATHEQHARGSCQTTQASALPDLGVPFCCPCCCTSPPAAFLRNNTPIYTAQGVEVVPFADGCMTEGKLMLHDSCIDKPTADNYTCEEQRAFGKCDFPFMVVSDLLYRCLLHCNALVVCCTDACDTVTLW